MTVLRLVRYGFLLLLLAPSLALAEADAAPRGCRRMAAAPEGATTPGMACCARCGERMGQAGTAAEDDAFAADHDTFFFLLDQRERITRIVTVRPDGVETLTESDDPKVAERLREHVAAMYRRLEEGDGIHLRDPLFAAVFQEADRIEMTMEPTEKGVRVIERSDDPAVAALIQAHADVVSRFLEFGRPEMHRDHPIPEATGDPVDGR